MGTIAAFRFPAHFDCGVQQLGENFEAGDKTRTGAGEVAVGIEPIDTSVFERQGYLANRPGKSMERYPSRAFALRYIHTARRSGSPAAPRLHHRASAGRKDGSARQRQSRPPANLIIFRNPVTANVNWLEPFEEGHSRAIAQKGLLLRGIDFLFEHTKFFRRWIGSASRRRGGGRFVSPTRRMSRQTSPRSSGLSDSTSGLDSKSCQNRGKGLRAMRRRRGIDSWVTMRSGERLSRASASTE